MAKDILTNTELIDSLIGDLNSLPKKMIDGQFIQFCGTVYRMGQKLINLRNTIDNDIKNRNKTIETLKEELRNVGHEVNDMTPAEFIKRMNQGKDGAENGGN